MALLKIDFLMIVFANEFTVIISLLKLMKPTLLRFDKLCLLDITFLYFVNYK